MLNALTSNKIYKTSNVFIKWDLSTFCLIIKKASTDVQHIDVIQLNRMTTFQLT